MSNGRSGNANGNSGEGPSKFYSTIGVTKEKGSPNRGTGQLKKILSDKEVARVQDDAAAAGMSVSAYLKVASDTRRRQFTGARQYTKPSGEKPSDNESDGDR